MEEEELKSVQSSVDVDWGEGEEVEGVEKKSKPEGVVECWVDDEAIGREENQSGWEEVWGVEKEEGEEAAGGGAKKPPEGEAALGVAKLKASPPVVLGSLF